MKKYYSPLKLQTKIILLVCGVVALSLLVTNILITRSIETNIRVSSGERAMDISHIVAHAPIVMDGLLTGKDAAAIQSYAEMIRSSAKVEFVVVFDMQGLRKSHPDDTLIGQHIMGGDEIQALRGMEYVSSATGTRGISLRAFTPVFAGDGHQIGAVVVGILLDDVERTVGESRRIIYFATILGLITGTGFALLLSRNIKKTLFGLEPFAIAKLVEERSAMLQSVREGVLAVDQNGIVTIANAETLRILESSGILSNPTGKFVDDCIPHSRLIEVLESGRSELDQEQDMNGVNILTNRFPIIVNNEIVGAIATFRDMTEMRQLAEELTGVSSYVEALRSQAHEFMNKLHVILGLVRLQMYEQLTGYINELANAQEAEIQFVGHCIRDPVLGGFLLSKFSRAREMKINMVLAKDSFLPEPAYSEMSHGLVTIVGNLIDNAFDAVKDQVIKRVDLSFVYQDHLLVIDVVDSGPGIDQDISQQIFLKGYSTKAENRGFGLFLVRRAVEELNGQIKLCTHLGEETHFTVSLPYYCKGELD
jgi:two-component system, CitB family, sensor histidine kinase MalK